MRLLGRRAECEALDGVLADALAGRSRVVVIRGEAGAGKSALLDYVSGRVEGWRVATAGGVESEMELAYSALHQLCAPMLDHLDRLPSPQRDAFETVFGLSNGPPPDRFLVGLATLTLLAEVAEGQPLVCVIDDAQWLDDASAQILTFVARRLLAERIALVCAARTGSGDDKFSGLPQLSVDGLGDSDARTLLLENVHGPLDAAVCEQIIAESHGNPLALLELPRTWNTAQLAGGFGLPDSHPVVGKIEESYTKRLLVLPAETQVLVLAAAADPLGNPMLLHRAADALGLDIAAIDPAVDAELLRVGARIEFAHPLVRSAAYRSAAFDVRHRVHRALAEATDQETDPDRRAWHRAHATSGPDEDVAAELERSAGRAQARGGLAAAAAFLERAAALSPDPERRARRALQAAEAKQLAGEPRAALTLLATAVDGQCGELQSAGAQRLRGQIALDLRRGAEAVPFLLDAAGRLESVDPALARETHLEALRAASISGRLGGDALLRAAEAARNAPAPAGVPRAVDLLLHGLAVRFTDGYAASAAPLRRALSAVRDESGRIEQDVRWPGFAREVAPDLFEEDAWHALATRGAQLARDRGALGVLPLALNYLATMRSFEGDLEAAEALLDESDAIAVATGTARIVLGRTLLAGFRGDDAAVSTLVDAAESAVTIRVEGVALTFNELARALLYNGLGQYKAALGPAESAAGRNELGVSVWSLPELVEAATRTGRTEVAAVALERLTERTRAAATAWALGIEARSLALLSDGPQAEEAYCQAIDCLSHTRLRPELARAHLVYGEWLRREGRRVDAREQLRTAHDMLVAIGMEAFAERARRELLATGEKARKRTAETRGDLTAQEAQIAQLAREGYSNPEIGAQLFLSPRTVEWHLRKVFTKLGIGSRKELDAALSAKAREPQPVQPGGRPGPSTGAILQRQREDSSVTTGR
jgi:DNA-binding CsgD family transcriptional regulator